MYKLHKFYKPNKYADIIIERDGKPLAAIHTKYCPIHQAYIVNQVYSKFSKGFGYFMYNLLFRIYEGEYFCPDRNLCLPKAFKVWNRLYHQNDDIAHSLFPNQTFTRNPDSRILNYRYRFVNPGYQSTLQITNHNEINDLYLESIQVFLDVYKSEMDYLENLLLSQGSPPKPLICSNPSFDHVLIDDCQHTLD